MNENIDLIGINIAEAAKLMGISKQLMAKLTKEDDFPCIKFQRRIVINKEQLPEWFKKHAGEFYVDY